jgi:hypothetical protein
MKTVLFWMRSNPISVAAGAVAFISLVFILWVLLLATPAQNEKLAQRDRKYRSVARLMDQQFTLPPAQVDGQPREVTGVRNPAGLEKRKSLRDELEQQRRNILQRAQSINQEGHVQLASNLFPQSPQSVRYDARQTYLDAFDAMLKAEDEQTAVSNLNLPRLDAGPPVSQQVMEQALERVTNPAMLMKREGSASGESPAGPAAEQRDGLTRQQYQQLVENRKTALKRALRRHAETHTIYARTGEGQTTGSDDTQRDEQEQAPKPFQVRPLASDRSPTMAQLWERQLELWIQQDIARAIAQTNADAQSVLDAPVKRLVRMRVWNGYVGLHTKGAANVLSASEQNNRGVSPDTSPRSGQAVAEQWIGAYGIPSPGSLTEPGEPVPYNFLITPTGRVSNHVWDIRHAVVTVVVDYKRLPRLINNLMTVNFMTVLDAHIEDVDEYAALQDGYIYGLGDMVKVDLVLESAWLRSWTKPMMPSVTRQYLGIDELPEDAQNNQNIPRVAGSER